jgi:D-xylono/L-arabinono-1,4-lactonase
MKAEVVVDVPCELGEGPFWHPDLKKLLWTDINVGTIHSFDPATGDHGIFHQGRTTGGFTLQGDGSLLLFHDRGTITRLKGGRTELIVESIPREWGSRFNDVQADPHGRVFCGTMSSENSPGVLYRLDRNGSLRPILENLGTPNGMAFSDDGETMYFTHTTPGEIWRYGFDGESGSLRDGKIFAKVPSESGRPDGLCMDTEGCIWSARYEGSCVVRYSPDGEEMLKIELPTPRVTSVAFGGAALDTLYITTAGGHNRAENGTTAGALFAVRPGAKGRLEPLSAVLL